MFPCAGLVTVPASPALAARQHAGRAAPPLTRPTARAFPRQHRVNVAASSAAVEAPASPAAAFPSAALARIAAKLQAAPDAKERTRLLLSYARAMPPPPPGLRTDGNRVMGCTSQAWLAADLQADGRLRVRADSDSELTRGLCAVLAEGLTGLTPEEVLAVDPACLAALGLGDAVLVRSRANGFLNMLEAAKRRARATLGQLPRFPSLLITAGGTSAQGAFAEAQEAFLRPDAGTVEALVEVLSSKKIGVVAHFYMDPQVQGVLSAAAQRWPHINISDSLVMADGAVRMAESGCTTIAVLGVDFMSENVRAILDEAGHAGVAVYRMAPAQIGCSLAEAAESAAYEAYLAEAAATPASLHVVYINTSLKTKALAHEAVPTITCTSSNVVQTVLQAFAQAPGATVWYGPDTYMGRNLEALLRALAAAEPADVAAVHPAHTPDTIASLLPRLRYFERGTCIVHHLFGGEVCELVRQGYGDAYLAAHFEVPGEMFALAMEARQRGAGVVGSTQNILDFIAARLGEALERPFPETLRVVLGTESGMITSIVLKVQAMLREAGRADVAVEVVFPVSADAITTEVQQRTSTPSSNGGSSGVALPLGLSVVPGPAGGEGCSLEGGCASCPYMKMNSLAALLSVCRRVGDPGGEALLEAYKPRPYTELVGGKTMAQAGCVPILHMRGFQRSGRLPAALVHDMLTRCGNGGGAAAAEAELS